ncbi:MAG TPA: NYN domain-containing protein [Thermoanaerobaculaceae bacterium]|nr:NYN domain-containing protein [Thermoanaerobaculaceae bacterium]HPS79902.1 NYN domain-containing protein [Thermoanaerobaculaceae bacterium]
MPWILDGNNLARGQGRELVRSAALALARHERVRIVLFFDGAPPPGSLQVERLGSIEVRYVANADSAILAAVSGGGRGWKLATDDRSLALRARDSGTEVVSSSAFWAKVDRASAAAGGAEKAPVPTGAGGASGERLPEAPLRIRQSPRKRRPW